MEKKDQTARSNRDGEYYRWHTEKEQVLGLFVAFLKEEGIIGQDSCLVHHNKMV